MKYADVILPLPLENSYTYRIPEDLQRAVTPGCRVIVHFGNKLYYTASVMEFHDREPVSDFETKEIYALLDATPVLRRPQLRFWKWISSYYICKLGDVYKAALPSGLKLESETAVTYNEDFEATAPLRPNEQAVLDAFSGGLKLTISELEKKTGLRRIEKGEEARASVGQLLGFKPYLESRFIEGAFQERAIGTQWLYLCGIGGSAETGYLGELRERGGSFTSIRLPLARAESAQSGARESLRRDP